VTIPDSRPGPPRAADCCLVPSCLGYEVSELHGVGRKSRTVRNHVGPYRAVRHQVGVIHPSVSFKVVQHSVTSVTGVCSGQR
jgi:hypothetical protein